VELQLPPERFRASRQESGITTTTHTQASEGQSTVESASTTKAKETEQNFERTVQSSQQENWTKPVKSVTFAEGLVEKQPEQSEAPGKAEPKMEEHSSSKKRGWISSVGEWLLGLEEESVASEEEGEEEQQLASPSPERSSTEDKPATPTAVPHSK
jgi:hypothetical protein